MNKTTTQSTAKQGRNGLRINHNETAVRNRAMSVNHNETAVCNRAMSLNHNEALVKVP